MRFFFLSILFLGFVVSCSRNQIQNSVAIGFEGGDSLKSVISSKERVLREYYHQLMDNKDGVDSLPNHSINELIKEYQIFYRLYPNDSMSPFYLDKIHQLFIQEKQYSYAVDWIDTLLTNYPNYKNKTLVLYSAATTSDMFLMDTNRVKRFYARILNESPKLKKEVRTQIQHRMKYLKIPYIDYIKNKSELK
jgi:hypothetical protein